LVAALQDWIRSWTMKPKLDIEIISKAPEFHSVPAVDLSSAWVSTVQMKPIEDIYKTYYFRFRVWNKGDVTAEKVEVILKRVYIRTKGGTEYKLDESFPIDNLNWSTIGSRIIIPIVKNGKAELGETLVPSTYCDYISPGTYKLCTLGHTTDPEHWDKDDYGRPPFDVNLNENAFCFDVSFRSNLKYYFKPSGTYKIEVQVAAANAKTITRWYEFTFSGIWFESQREMIEKGFEIRIAKKLAEIEGILAEKG